MEKTFCFGKIAYTAAKRVNLVALKVKWNDGVFTVCGEIWNAVHSDCATCGQCLDTIAKHAGQLSNRDLFSEIYDLWKRWHHNDLHTGTVEQEAAIIAHFGDRRANRYREECGYLKSIRLLTVPAEQADKYRQPGSPWMGKPGTYGHEWFFYPVSAEDTKRIEALFTK